MLSLVALLLALVDANFAKEVAAPSNASSVFSLVALDLHTSRRLHPLLRRAPVASAHYLDTLSKEEEEEAKRAWLAKLDAPAWGAVMVKEEDVLTGFRDWYNKLKEETMLEALKEEVNMICAPVMEITCQYQGKDHILQLHPTASTDEVMREVARAHNLVGDVDFVVAGMRLEPGSTLWRTPLFEHRKVLAFHRVPVIEIACQYQGKSRTLQLHPTTTTDEVMRDAAKAHNLVGDVDFVVAGMRLEPGNMVWQSPLFKHRKMLACPRVPRDNTTGNPLGTLASMLLHFHPEMALRNLPARVRPRSPSVGGTWERVTGVKRVQNLQRGQPRPLGNHLRALCLQTRMNKK